MLGNGTVSATLPAQDIERAKSFYADKLGLKPVLERDHEVMYELGGATRFALFQSSGAASGDHTQLGIEVEDFDATVADLRSNGVRFQEYDLPGFKTEDGIATLGGVRGVWIKDSEGNLLAISEPYES